MRVKRILVVDKNEAIRRLFWRYLSIESKRRKEPVEIERASNAPDALELFKGSGFHIAFIGVGLGMNWDGFKVASEFKKVDPNICIVLMSGSWWHGTRAVSEFGFFMKKPFELEEIAFHVFQQK